MKVIDYFFYRYFVLKYDILNERIFLYFVGFYFLLSKYLINRIVEEGEGKIIFKIMVMEFFII